MGEPLGEEQMLLSLLTILLCENTGQSPNPSAEVNGGARKRIRERVCATNQASPCSLGQMLRNEPHCLKLCEAFEERCLMSSLSGCYCSASKVKAILHGLLFSDE